MSANKIVLIIEGGLIHEVIADSMIEVLTIDHDTEGGDQQCIREIPQDNASSQKCYIRFEEVLVDALRLAKLWRVAAKGEQSASPGTKNPEPQN